MIDSDFIIKYTDGLYRVAAEDCPRYDEFRDMFSSGQIKSKEWAVSCLSPYLPYHASVIIAGSWFGTLGAMLNKKNPGLSIELLDIDPRCKVFVDKIMHWNESIKSITGDMYHHNYRADVVINTSCEHIPDLKAWLALIPSGTTVLLQSNNNDKMDGHVNCCKSVDEFQRQAGLSQVFYSGEYVMPMYTRYMVIGKV